jgi:8-oxo-dGTP diphosphatase
VPDHVLKNIELAINHHKPSEDHAGYERGSNTLKEKTLTYQNLKRLKNYFDNIDKEGFDQIEFDLNGGENMKNFINDTLSTERNKVKTSKENKSDYAQMDNQFRKTHTKDGVNEDFNIGKIVEKIVMEKMDEVKRVSIAIIIDNNDKYFLAQREPNDDWMPSKWAFVGGTGEPNETPEQTLYRELKEEISVTPKWFEKKDAFHNRETNTIETLFLVKLNEGYIKLDYEHTNFGWFTIKEIHQLDTVPKILDYILKTK